MWPSNGFKIDINNFDQDGYEPSHFEGLSGQQFFPQSPFPSDMVQYENSNRDGFMINDLQPEVALYNEGAFTQNQFANSWQAQFSPAQPSNLPAANTPRSSRPITSISSRAAELKALLLKSRDRANSSTPPVTMIGQAGRQQSSAADGSSSLRGSPITPATASKPSEQELNINDLISQYAELKPAADTQTKDGNNDLPSLSQRPSSLSETFAKSQGPSLGSPTKVTKLHNGTMIGNGTKIKKLEGRHISSGSMSDGEIFEERAIKKVLPPTESKDAKAVTKAINTEDLAPHDQRDKQSLNSGSVPRDVSPRGGPPTNPKADAPHHSEDDRNEADPRQDRRPYPSNYINERRHYPSYSDRSPQRRDIRDQNGDGRRSDINGEKHKNTRNHSGAKPPSLKELLLHDEDLREWLEITGYHNGLYRSKVLSRRRAIAALDAQRNALLAEMEAEERGIMLGISGIPTISTTMLPPPIPNKVGDRTEASLKHTAALPEIQQRDCVISNKRSRSEVQDPREESSSKIARADDRGARIRQDDKYSRPRSSGYDQPHHRSFDDQRDDRKSPRARYGEDHDRGRGSTREREFSPGINEYESRPLPRSRDYDGGDDFYMRDRDDWEDGARDRNRSSERSDRRPYEVRGGYKGRAYDPNYRSRGRGRGGRGRGDYQNHSESRSDSGAVGARIANGKPYKDTTGFDRGGKGGQ